MTVPVPDSTSAAEHFFVGARNAGLAHVVVSPGSRSTPLTVAVARTPDLSYSIELDERVAAFVALGYAKASGKAVALVCTSGTAAANYLPAVAEASMSNIPLIIVTADRPPEHQHWGVGQSFDQRGLFNRQVRCEITMPVGGDGGVDFTVRAGWRAVATAIEQHGPVHINWAFRIPLEPVAGPIDYTTPLGPVPDVDYSSTDDAAVLAQRLQSASAPLIVAGPNAVPAHCPSGSAQQVLDVASALGIPVLADVLSGLRGSPAPALIGSPALITTAPDVPMPDLIVRLGHTPTSKAIRLWWESIDVEHVLVDPLDEWQDPSHTFTTRVRSTPAALFASIEEAGAIDTFDSAWLSTWRRLADRVTATVDATLTGWPTTTEAHIARMLAEAASASDRIVASSSMPVRDLDMFAPVSAGATMLANRGINGIDGVVSTALGAQRASDGGRTNVLIGDIATLHDVGGVLAAARAQEQLTIIIPNNDGGGIFSFLPVRNVLDDPQFDELFHTPHGTTFEFLAGHVDITYRQDTNVAAALADARHIDGVVIIEVPVDTPERLSLQRAIDDAIQSVDS